MKKLGKILPVILLVLALTVAGGFAWLYRNGMSGVSKTTEAAERQLRVACVGDSITYGHGTTSWPRNTYPAKLQTLLGDGWHVNNYGVSGYAVQESSDRPYSSLEHYRESLEYNADFVVFMMGTNDSKPENWKGADAFREDLLALLDSYSDTEVILCAVSAAFCLEGQTEGVTSHDIQPPVVEEIAEVIRQVARERQYPLVDIHSLTAENPQWLARDGVHPGDEGAGAIAQAVYETLSQMD